MISKLENMRDEAGKFHTHAWPGGYPLFYLTRDGDIVCPNCANREVDQRQEVISGDVNWEDAGMYCDDCGERIESAYGDPEHE